MKIDLDGVKGGQDITGVQSKTVTFTIGRSQVSTVDMNTQHMTVKRMPSGADPTLIRRTALRVRGCRRTALVRQRGCWV